MQRNRLEVLGYLASKPATRRLPSGMNVATVRLGESYRYEGTNGKTEQHTNWHNLSFYGDLARIALSFEKGDHLFIEGTIEQRQFTPKDGAQRTVHEVVVWNCHLVAPPRLAVLNDGAAEPAEEQPAIKSEAGEHDAWPVG